MSSVTPKTTAINEAGPQSLKEMFWCFSRISLQGFGGVLPIIQKELVERLHWLSNEEFVENFAIAQVMPGPNVINLSILIGNRYFGVRGALVAIVGFLLLPLVLLLAIAFCYASIDANQYVDGALKGMAAVSAGLVAGMALKLSGTLKHHPLGKAVAWSFVLASLLAVGYFRLPLVYNLLVLGGMAALLTYQKIHKKGEKTDDLV